MIYPLLWLIPSQAVQEYSFLVALAVVYGLSWALRGVTASFRGYESAASACSILETIYEGRFDAFRRRIARETVVESVSAIYFGATTIVLLLLVMGRDSSSMFALVVFAFLSIGAVTRASKLYKATTALSGNAAPPVYMSVAYSIYGLDYNAYYQSRDGKELKDLLPPRPPRFRLFLVCSAAIAVICALLGAIFFIGGVISILAGLGHGFVGMGIINVLYGTLALFYGIRDTIDCFSSLRRKQ